MKYYLLFLFFTIASFGINGQDKFRNPRKIDENNKSKISFDKNLIITKIKTDSLKISRGENNLPIFITGKILNPKVTKYARGTMESKAFGYLESLKETLKITAPQNEFLITTSETDELNQQHIRMKQVFKGIPVYGGEMILHTDGIEVDKLNGRYFPTPKLTGLTPAIKNQKAIDIVKSDLKKVSIFQNLTKLEKSVLKYAAPKSELIIYHENEDLNKEFLTWKIEIRPNLIERWEYFVDAKSGKIISKYNNTCAVDGPATATATDLNNISRSIKSYQKGSNYFLIDATKDMYKGAAINVEDEPVGVIWTIDASNRTPEDMNVKQVASSNNTWTNKTAVSAHFNASLAYDYYKIKHNRLSLNGKGGTIISIINITEENEKTGAVQQMDNAFWNGQYMGYGNGNTFFKPLAGGLDVAGHEMTHGVIENTANLNYQGQSGAINESMADVFGVLIDRQDGDFVVGEDVMKSGPFLRSLSDPNKGDQPAHMNQIYTGSEDNGGVHINSGIPNKAFHLFVKGLSGNEEQQKSKAEKVYYRALTKYLTPSSKFIDLRAAIVQSCKDLAGDVGADAETAANAAFAAVGIGSSGDSSAPTQKPVEDLPANTGSEFILSYDPCDKSIYNSDKTFTNNIIIVKDVIIDHKPSVTDDGSFAYYVAKKEAGKGGTLNRVNLSGTPKVEILSADAVWSNVAVSKDGKRLAVNTVETSEDDQKKIYIVNLETGDLKGFPLYNPTYSSTVRSAGTPAYSDALEWEYNGEYVIYDAYNEIKSNTLVGSTAENTINYWDVGLIHAWDIAKNALSDGTITKVFTNLAKNESIGNPSFAKKSTSVVAFDRIFDGKFSILTVDFESKGQDGGYKRAEVTNNTIGFPEFSASDDKVLFNRVVTNRSKGCTIDSTNTASMNLAADKITYNGTSKLDFIEKSSLAVWYTVGQRQLPKATQVINIALPDITAGTASTVILVKTTDKGNPITYKVISGPASIVSGNLALTGQPGKVKLQGDAPGSTTTNAVQSLFEFCVFPAKPSITITNQVTEYLFTSSADTGNNWYRNGVALNVTEKSIQVITTNTFTVQVVIDGCKSEFSNEVTIPKEKATQVINNNLPDIQEGSATKIDLIATTDKGNPIVYKLVSETPNASISGNELTLNGKPGKIKIQADALGNITTEAVQTIFEFCVFPSKPTIEVTEKTSTYLLSSSAPVGNVWFKDGAVFPSNSTKDIEVNNTSSYTVKVVVDGCESQLSDAVKVDVMAAQTISVVTISDKVEGDKSSINLTANTSAGNAVIYSIVSGPASISGNQIVLSGQAGRVKVKGTSPATAKNTAAEINYDFCVNPSKPSISITSQSTEYLFTSSALTGNNWYRNGVSLNITENSILVVNTNTFTVQVVIDGCTSEFSNEVTTPKEKATQVINNNLPDIQEGSASKIDLAATTDKGNSIIYKLVSVTPNASISGNVLTLNGKPGKIKIQADAQGNITTDAVQTIFEFCVLPTKPTIVVSEKTLSYLLSSSAPVGNIWLKDGAIFPNNSIKDIEITNTSSYTVKVVIDGCESPQSDAVKVGAITAQTISVVTIADKVEGDKSAIILTANTSAGNAVTYSVVSGPASISGNQIVLSGQAGRVKVKGTSPATAKNTAAEINYDFCVNPSKPSISISSQATEFLFTSSAATGNNWYRNGVALNVTEKSIMVVNTNTFTVQVVIDGCKSEFSNEAAAQKILAIVEEALEKVGISVYPNPVSDYLILKYGNTKINQVSVSNLSGISLFTKEDLKGNELNIDLKSIPKGLYLLNLKTSKGEFSKKLLKE